MDASKLDALVRQCQAVMVEYLVPGGIDAEQAMARMIELLDGPEQREAQAPFEPGVPYLNGKPFMPSEENQTLSGYTPPTRDLHATAVQTTCRLDP